MQAVGALDIIKQAKYSSTRFCDMRAHDLQGRVQPCPACQQCACTALRQIPVSQTSPQSWGLVCSAACCHVWTGSPGPTSLDHEPKDVVYVFVCS